MTIVSGSKYPPTWYAAHAREFPLQPALDSTIKSEVCIVGGGLAGLSIAWQLASKGVSVVLLEARRIAWGASGRNGGFVSPGFAADIESVARLVGQSTAKRLYRYTVEGAETVRRQVAELAPHSLMAEGKFSVSRYPAAASMRATADMLTNDYDDPVEYLEADTLHTYIRSERYFEGIFKPRGFQIQPLDYSRGLAAAIINNGGKLFEQTSALQLHKNTDNGGWSVTTAQGRVEAGQVVLCTSGYDSSLYRPLSRSILPVATHVVVTKPLSAVQLESINTRCGIADTGNACDYYRLIDGNRLLWGGKITTVTGEPKNLDQIMGAAMADVFPALSDIGLDYRWSGLMGYCRHKMPLIRQPESRLWIASAFGGHGLNTTAMAGNLIGNAIVDGDQSWTDFSQYDPVWNGGLLGQAAVQSSYWWMQAKDRYLEARATRVR